MITAAEFRLQAGAGCDDRDTFIPNFFAGIDRLNRNRIMGGKRIRDTVAHLRYIPSALMHDFLNTDYYQSYEESWYSDLGLSPWTQDVCNRVHEYAEDGGDGRTHREVIDLQRDAVNAAGDDGELWEPLADRLVCYLDDVEDWHHRSGTLDDVIG